MPNIVSRVLTNFKAIYTNLEALLIRKNLHSRLSSFLIKLTPKSIAMSNAQQIQALEQENRQLEDKIRGLVDTLEQKKSEKEIKVPKDAIIRSKQEQEAAAKLEALALNSEKPASADTQPERKEDKAQASKPEKQARGGKGKQAAAEPEKPLDVSRLDLRIGKIIEVDKHPDADALYVEKIDCGDSTGPRTVISGLVKHVPIDEMRDRFVVVLCNLKPVKMRGILSEAMVMCASSEEKVELISPPAGVKPGDRVVFDNFPGEPDAQLNPKKKIWEQVAPDIKTDVNGVARYKDSPFKVGHLGDQLFKSSLSNVQIR